MVSARPFPFFLLPAERYSCAVTSSRLLHAGKRAGHRRKLEASITRPPAPAPATDLRALLTTSTATCSASTWPARRRRPPRAADHVHLRLLRQHPAGAAARSRIQGDDGERTGNRRDRFLYPNLVEN